MEEAVLAARACPCAACALAAGPARSPRPSPSRGAPTGSIAYPLHTCSRSPSTAPSALGDHATADWERRGRRIRANRRKFAQRGRRRFLAVCGKLESAPMAPRADSPAERLPAPVREPASSTSSRGSTRRSRRSSSSPVIAGVWLGADRGYGALELVAAGRRRAPDLDPDRVLAAPARLPLGARPPDRQPPALHHPRRPPRPSRTTGCGWSCPRRVSIPLAALFLWRLHADLRHSRRLSDLRRLHPRLPRLRLHPLLPAPLTSRRRSSASGCASSTCATTSRTTVTGTASPPRSGTSCSGPCRASGGLSAADLPVPRGPPESRRPLHVTVSDHTTHYTVALHIPAEPPDERITTWPSALDEAASLLKNANRELDAERKKLERALANLTGGRLGRRGPGRPRASSERDGRPPPPPPRAAAPAPTRRSSLIKANPGITRLRDGEEDEDQAELPLPGARRAREGGPGEEVGPHSTTSPDGYDASGR